METVLSLLHSGVLNLATAAFIFLIAIPTYRWGNKFGAGVQVGLGFMNIALGLMQLANH